MTCSTKSEFGLLISYISCLLFLFGNLPSILCTPHTGTNVSHTCEVVYVVKLALYIVMVICYWNKFLFPPTDQKGKRPAKNSFKLARVQIPPLVEVYKNNTLDV